MFYRAWGETDLRDILPSIRVPTLVLYRGTARAQMLDVAGRIKGALAIEIDETSFANAFEDITREVERFLSTSKPAAIPDTVLTTVLFTDIVGSTQRAADLGDRAWRDLLREHQRVVRRELARFRGEEKDTAGDGFFATFDGPARAIRCAETIVAAAPELGLEIRAGVHTGECEFADGKVAGLAVHIGARIVAEAAPSQVLVSSTVKDLVAGSQIEFEELGVCSLKGVPGEWQLYSVATATDAN
jgi:class 3 adenylate cyclase